ncbi:MAG: DUF4292 domain-containing protein [Urechidicola sp.]|nr:DUF4292 domain-containing protein [Urechidicola sp.]
MLKKTIYILFVTALLVSCKSKIVEGSTAIATSSKNIVKSHYEHQFDKKTINARLKAVYTDTDNLQTVTIKLRLEKDKTIWMSGTMLGIPFAKIIITPTNVQFYEKLNKTFFVGDFTLLSDFLGTDVDFEIVQNLLIGQSILDLKEKKYSAKVQGNTYMLVPKKQEELFDILFWINPVNFKINKQEVRQESEQKRLTVDYTEYQKIKDEVFPKVINITAVEKATRTFIDLEYKSVEFDRKLSFPFKIPQGYKEIYLNE